MLNAQGQGVHPPCFAVRLWNQVQQQLLRLAGVVQDIETFASVRVSAPSYRFAENIGFVPIVEAELKPFR